MILLDTFCKAGGCSRGFADAGFTPIGVDREPQPNYPYPFIQADALDVLTRLAKGWPIMVDGEWMPADQIVAVHASPPCQSKTAYRRKGYGVGDGYPNLIGPVRALLTLIGKPYVIENVMGARDELRNPVKLCGSSFGLDVQRHRLFETNWQLEGLPCDHSWQTPRFPGATNRAPLSRRTVEIGVWRIPLDVQQRAMGIDWMTLPELSEAIPPAYTKFIGDQLMRLIATERKETPHAIVG